ncbi:M48 family metalloprotease [Psychroserpens algicola]|uniref:M48 family metalloprotease n=1 Tax=Psychroserpens algicola TaxID=1719034 RepID=UPI001955009B|nr:M48 family metalloprotease [Psychroserpens algicola]
MIKNYLLCIVCVLISAKIFAQQESTSNAYLPEDIEAVEDYLEQINSDYIKRIKGDYASKVKKIFKDRDEKVVKSIKDSAYIFSSEIDGPFYKILENVYAANPEIDKTNYRFFINNSFIPNAACYGDGMFEVNLGLFNTFTSDDEVAFVICHEIAHKLLDHSLHHVTNAISKINSKETKEKVRHIKRQKYGQTRAALSVIDELNIDILDHSKEKEAEADSLGFILYSKTIYHKSKAISALEKLKVEDDMLLNHHVKVDSVFDFESYPFKSYWLKETISIFDTEEKINEFELSSDTLKTHPEIEFRVNKLKDDFGVVNLDVAGTKDQMKFIKDVSHQKAIQSTIDRKLLDFAIYQLVEKFQNNRITATYYYHTMAEVIKQIYEAKRKHELGKYVPPKNNFSDEKHLNVIRLFLHNLELKETKKMGLAFCETHKESLKTSDSGIAIHEFFKSINQ